MTWGSRFVLLHAQLDARQFARVLVGQGFMPRASTCGVAGESAAPATPFATGDVGVGATTARFTASLSPRR
jgi:hypothetical protein